MSKSRRRRQQQLNALGDELFVLRRASRSTVERDGERSFARQLGDALALSDSHPTPDLDAAAAVALTFCAAVWPQLEGADAALSAWRAELARDVPVVGALREARLGVWQTGRQGGARPVVATPFGVEAPEAQRLNAVLLPAGDEVRKALDAPLVGWLLERGVVRVLVVLGGLDAQAAESVRGALDAPGLLRGVLDSAARGCGADPVWQWVEPAPAQREQPDPDASPPPMPAPPVTSGPAAVELARLRQETDLLGRMFADRAPGRLTRRDELLHRLRAWLDARAHEAPEGPRALVWWREEVAMARSADDLVVLRALIAAARDLNRVTRFHCAVDRVRFERELPVDEVLEALCGVRPDATMPGAASFEVLQRAPCSALKLAADHPVFVELTPGAPIGAALQWTAATGGEDGRAIETAFATLRAEQRWLATWQDGDVLRSEPQVAWDHAAHALHHLFAPALREEPLEVLALPARFESRLGKLAQTLGELPLTSFDLHDLGAVGNKTERALVEHLVARMRTWRGPLQSAAPDMARADEVRSGLDELASLFDEE